MQHPQSWRVFGAGKATHGTRSATGWGAPRQAGLGLEKLLRRLRAARKPKTLTSGRSSSDLPSTHRPQGPSAAEKNGPAHGDVRSLASNGRCEAIGAPIACAVGEKKWGLGGGGLACSRVPRWCCAGRYGAGATLARSRSWAQRQVHFRQRVPATGGASDQNQSMSGTNRPNRSFMNCGISKRSCRAP